MQTIRLIFKRILIGFLFIATRRQTFLQVYLLLTEKCNLNCGMCIRGRQNGTEFSCATLKKIFSSQSFKIHDVILTGGEPTLHSNFSEILGLAAAHAKTVTVTTNGTLKSRFAALTNIGDNVSFQISVDGDEIFHDKIRGAGNFQKTFDTIRLLDEKSFRYALASVVNRNNLQSMSNLLKIVESLPRLEHWKISYEMPFGSASLENSLPVETWNAFVDEIIKRARCRLLIKKIFPFELYDKNFDKLRALLNTRGRVKNCGGGRDKIYVYPDLKVYPCTCLKDFCVGNLETETLDEILSGDAIKPFVEYKISARSKCRDCKYKIFCNGGCIGMSWHVFKKFGMGDVRCPRLKTCR